ncbi:MAG: type I polyketide synthase [Armatimonadetes bacterium]|nr:type I polyketide synthase [Armatimonadota bacterium]
MLSIAVVGLGGVFPGAADPRDFWQNVASGADQTREAPPGRWVLPPDEAHTGDSPGADQVASRRGCFVDEVELDRSDLDLDLDRLGDLDPLYWMALKAGVEAFRDGVTAGLDRSRVGVVLAAIALPTEKSSQWSLEVFEESLRHNLTGRTRPAELSSSPYNAHAVGMPAGLLARALGLGGGSYTLDSACASSLYALKLACDELISGRADAMLAGGVSRPDCLYTQMGFTALGALSPSGRCSPFDIKGDGLVVGEGAGMLLLKRLEDARRDGDQIYGVIRGIGLSNDVGGSLLAPDTEGQLRALRDAYRQASWEPDSVELIECHGTGTPVGDRVEFDSLKHFWQGRPFRSGQCVLGSVKSQIGHLLTAAGAAGVIKVLMAVKHGLLPPTANFERPAKGIELAGSPFRVLRQAETWERPGRPRRGAVSAFGFGGINAHVLLEEWDGQAPEPAMSAPAHKPVAIVGMAARFGRLEDYRTFLEASLTGETAIESPPAGRWNDNRLLGAEFPGCYLDRLRLPVGKFRIPPKDVPSLLPQQILMLDIALQAAEDARLEQEERRVRAGTFIGIGLDLETTNFHLRWALPGWAARQGLPLSPDELQALRDSASPPLDATRTMGALGSIVASRVARELSIGGPSYAISAEEASGIRALEVAVRALQADELDCALVGAVDLAGDVRAVLAADRLRRYDRDGRPRPFDVGTRGPAIGEGAVALVLKRLDDAVRDGDRVYAVIRGIGSSSGGGVDRGVPTPEAYRLALLRAYEDASVAPATVGYIEAHGSGDPEEDRVEAGCLKEFFSEGELPCAVGSTAPVIGSPGAAAGLASVARGAGCLFQEILPPLAGFAEPGLSWSGTRFHFPARPLFWYRDRKDGPRRAGVSCMARDGNCAHVVLEAVEHAPDSFPAERATPLGAPSYGLFAVTGPDLEALTRGLRELGMLAAAHPGSAHELARAWYWRGNRGAEGELAVTLVARSSAELLQALERIGTLRGPAALQGQSGVFFSPGPLGREGEIAFLYPGSGNHYLGMGAELEVRWPEAVRRMDAETPTLASQHMRWLHTPYRQDWLPGWEADSERRVASDPLAMIFGSVTHGVLATDVAASLGIRPRSVIGYSLGESAALLATRAWPDRDEIYRRTMDSALFRTQLSGRCEAVRQAWGLAEDTPFEWKVAVLNRPAEQVRQALLEHTALLIVNTAEECVIGGESAAVDRVVARLGCEAYPLEGVPTVHCDAARAVEEDYYQLHLLETRATAGLRFYSGNWARAFEPTAENAARSILDQALEGLDFPRTILQAYEDGVRIFLEMGPRASCTRMVRQVLGERPHAARSISVQGESEELTALKLLAFLIAERVPGLSLAPLCKLEGAPRADRAAVSTVDFQMGQNLPRLLSQPVRRQPEPRAAAPQPRAETKVPDAAATAPQSPARLLGSFAALQRSAVETSGATARAHQAFLARSQEALETMAQGVALQTRLLEAMIQAGVEPHGLAIAVPSPQVSPARSPQPAPAPPREKPWLPRELCLEYAIGSIARVLGPEFAEVDTYPTRVRLPDEPLMLVDRIMAVEGEPRSMSSGRVITEHDVLADAWYLDAGRTPVFVSVEAGQADLFLSGYLGIDLKTKGRRVYRLLDAAVEFHRGLPRPGETIRYDIRIDRFVRQGEVHLFFFEFDGTIAGKRLITMRNGCAGFFTYEEIENSGGIISSQEKPPPGERAPDWRPLVPFSSIERYDDRQVAALRQGDLGACFGPAFAALSLRRPSTLPGGRLKLFDRVLEIDPNGGRYGIGRVRTEADIHPDDWFLTCHFVDDMVMPGTLMYECCAHSLRFLLLRMGWVAEAGGVAYEPVQEIPAVLKCRGPVDVRTRKVHYQVDIKAIGYRPEPYVLADALMFADGKPIVSFADMSVQLTGVTREQLEALWTRPVLYDKESILQFSNGRPSLAFGEPYAVFDRDRRIARLPGPPYQFMDCVTEVNQAPFALQPGGWVEAEYTIPPDEWYFRANRQGSMAFCVLLEIALQPCGWLAAYAGSALHSREDLHFRNLGGQAVLHRELFPHDGKIRVRVRMTKVSEAGGMIIEWFDMKVLAGEEPIYEGTTYFGFFSVPALAQQIGLRDHQERIYEPAPEEVARALGHQFPVERPRDPQDPAVDPASRACLPGKALMMLDRIDQYVPDGGRHRLGFVRGSKVVDPAEWFFEAHFYQDPVMPGSLGLEAFLQALKYVALERFPHLRETHRFEPILVGREHSWVYRGQLVPTNRRMEIEAVVSEVVDGDRPHVMADGFLTVDGLYVYEMKDFGVRLVPK